jgi:hypothetical protein
MKPVVIIHTNDAQLLAARVCMYSLKAASAQPDSFDVRLLRLEQVKQVNDRLHGSRIRYADVLITWDGFGLQAFTPLRMLVPELLDYRRRALVLDPDIVAVGDVADLFQEPGHDRPVSCRTRKSWRPEAAPEWSTAVMLLDCEKLGHWRWHEAIDRVLNLEIDLLGWLHLAYEPPENIGYLSEEWNHFDTLTSNTRLLHFTDLRTQPWRTGLPLDYRLHSVGAEVSEPPLTRAHPDARQELLFFKLLLNAIEAGAISYDFVAAQVREGWLRPDASSILDQIRIDRPPARFPCNP